MYVRRQPRKRLSLQWRPQFSWRLMMSVAAVVLLTVVILALIQAGKKDPDVADAPQHQANTGSAIPRVAEIKNPLASMRLYVDPNSNAAKQAAAWRTTRPGDAAAMDRLAAQPIARWFTSTPSLREVNAYVEGAATAGSVPVLVAYSIPERDCGMYSAGGAGSVEEYKAYIGELASRIGGNKAVVILEPDALPGTIQNGVDGKPCLSKLQQAERYQLLSEAVTRLKKQPGVAVYMDAGNSGWIRDVHAMADILRRAGVAKADGFSLNISNFRPLDEVVRYGEAVSRLTGGKHFVVDTSRNGMGAYENPKYPDISWCNPPGRALGHRPTTAVKESKLADAYLYVKSPGESDGQDADPDKCFGGGAAGTWMPEYALGLIGRWPAELQ